MSVMNNVQQQLSAAKTQSDHFEKRLIEQQGAVEKSFAGLKLNIDDGLKAARGDLHEEILRSNKALQAQIDVMKAASSSAPLPDLRALKKEILQEVATSSSSSARPPFQFSAQNFNAVNGGGAARSEPSTYISTRLFIKGWCPYGMDSTKGLSSETALKIGHSILAFLPCDMSSDLAPEPLRAPYHKNRQISINLKEDIGPKRAMEIARFLSDYVKGHNILI
jgi:hypothetical protein